MQEEFSPVKIVLGNEETGACDDGNLVSLGEAFHPKTKGRLSAQLSPYIHSIYNYESQVGKYWTTHPIKNSYF